MVFKKKSKIKNKKLRTIKSDIIMEAGTSAAKLTIIRRQINIIII